MTGTEIFGLLAKLRAAGILAALHHLSRTAIFWDLQMHGGGEVALASVTIQTPLKELLYGAANSQVKLFLLAQIVLSLSEIKAALLPQQQPPPPPVQQQQSCAQILMNNGTTTLRSCIAHMPG